MKQKKHTGAVYFYIVGLVLLSLAAFSAMITRNDSDKATLIEKNRVFTGDSLNTPMILTLSDYKMLVNIHNISEPIETGAKNVVAYFVVTENNDIFLLEASADDQALRTMSDTHPALADNPGQVVVKAYLDSDAIRGFLSQTNLKEEFKQQVRSDLYLSTYEVDRERQQAAIRHLLLASMGLVAFGSGIFRYLTNKKAYRKLFEHYPELAEDPDLIRQADFYDEELGLALYQNHLIAFRFGVEAIDLRNIKGLHYIFGSHGHGRKPKQSIYYLELYPANGKKILLHFKKVKPYAKERFAALFSLIEKRYPGIAFLK